MVDARRAELRRGIDHPAKRENWGALKRVTEEVGEIERALSRRGRKDNSTVSKDFADEVSGRTERSYWVLFPCILLQKQYFSYCGSGGRGFESHRLY